VYGLWSLVVEAFERGISLGVKKHEFRRPSQSRLLSPLREGSDGEARPIDLLARIGHPEFPQVLGDTTVLSVSVYGGAEGVAPMLRGDIEAVTMSVSRRWRRKGPSLLRVKDKGGNVGDLLQDGGGRVKKGYTFISRSTAETGKSLRGVPLTLSQGNRGQIPITLSLLTNLNVENLLVHKPSGSSPVAESAKRG
ncbi:unnamed protein product, partial [Fusarium fujikuroi]